MLLTVTPNVCLERTVVIDNFAAGLVHRVPPEQVWTNAGGKGINAARIAAALGCPVLATGWVGRRQAAWFRDQLDREGVPHDLVEVTPDTRVCTNILDGAGAKTEIVEAGNPLRAGDGARLLRKFESLLPRAALVAVCGSYPPPAATPLAPDDAPLPLSHLSLLVSSAQRRGLRVIVDGKGPPLAMALRERPVPWCIKPNLDEAAQLLRHPIDGVAGERRALGELLRLGVEVVLLSCGARGAYLATKAGSWFLRSPAVREVSPVGSGDALVGAFAARFLERDDLLEAARWGVAAGAANAAQVTSAFCEGDEIAALLPAVRVEVQPALL